MRLGALTTVRASGVSSLLAPLGAFAPVACPRAVAVPKGTYLLATGEHHCVAVTQSGHFTIGRGSHHRLGSGGVANAEEWLGVAGQLTACGISCGARHNLVATREGTLWGWGCNRAGQLMPSGQREVVEEGRAVPLPSELWLPKTVVDVACGFDWTIAVVGDDSVLLWGRVVDELCDRASLAPYAPQPGVWTVPSVSGASVVELSAGFAHALLRTRDGRVFGMGAHRHGQCGSFEGRGPHQVALPTAATSVACGSSHSCAVTHDGRLWVWGSAGDAKLAAWGSDSATPLPVEGLPPVRKVRCGVDHTIAVCVDGSAWAFGFAQHGALGVGSLEQHAGVRRVAIDDARVVDAMCGADLTLFACESHH